ncbi:MAG: hypothetical protein V3R25_05685 [Nitrosomonadaceae bacterium]
MNDLITVDLRQCWRRLPEQDIEKYIIREFKGNTVLLAREILKLRREKNNDRP